MTMTASTRERVAKNLGRLLEGREAEIAEAIGSRNLTAAQRASNLRRYTRDKFPGPETLDALAEALGVDVSELFKESR